MIFATLPQRCNRILDPRPAAASLLPFRYADESTSRLFAPMQLLRHAGRSRPFHTTTSHGAPGRSGKNHYETLGVQSDAPLKDIKSRFYKLSKQYHPDVNKDSDEAHSKFIKINEAYTILSNPLSRREYDRTLRVSDRDGGVTASRSGFGGFRRPPARTAYYGSDHRGSATSWSRASASQQTGQHQHQHQHQRYQGMGGHAHGANTTGPSSSSRSFDFNEWEQKHYGAERAARAEKIR
ncbi:DnaJ molecular chaperone y domain, partial [Spiromyces aspiralis]